MPNYAALIEELLMCAGYMNDDCLCGQAARAIIELEAIVVELKDQ